MRYAVGSSLVRWYLAPGGHIGLFIGRRSQAEYWTPNLAQVRELSRPGGIANASTSTSTPSAGGASGKENGESNGLLSGCGDLDGAEQILRARAGAGDEWAVRRLAELLAERGDLDGAEQGLEQQRTASGDSELKTAGLPRLAVRISKECWRPSGSARWQPRRWQCWLSQRGRWQCWLSQRVSGLPVWPAVSGCRIRVTGSRSFFAGAWRADRKPLLSRGSVGLLRGL